MHAEFSSNKQKQGVNLWGKVAIQLSSIYHDFDKDSEACRKKWAQLLNQYRADKTHNMISGNDRKITCKWFDIMDEYCHDRASVTCVSHASSGGDCEGPSHSEMDTTPSDNCGEGSTPKNNPRINVGPKPSLFEEEMIQTGRALVDRLKEAHDRHETLESKKLEVLTNMSSTLMGLLDLAKSK